MTSLSAVQKHKLYVSNCILTDHAQLLVSTKVNDFDSLIASMNGLITPENKKTLVTRILTLTSYGDSSNTGPCSIDEMYLNHIIDQDLFDRISDNDQAGLLMEKTTLVTIKKSSGDSKASCNSQVTCVINALWG